MCVWWCVCVVLAGQRPPKASAAAVSPLPERDAPDESSPVPRMPEPSESPAAVGLAGRAGRGRLAAGPGPGLPPHTPLPMGAPGLDESAQMGAGSPAGYVELCPTHTHTHTQACQLACTCVLNSNAIHV